MAWIAVSPNLSQRVPSLENSFNVTMKISVGKNIVNRIIVVQASNVTRFYIGHIRTLHVMVDIIDFSLPTWHALKTIPDALGTTFSTIEPIQSSTINVSDKNHGLRKHQIQA